MYSLQKGGADERKMRRDLRMGGVGGQWEGRERGRVQKRVVIAAGGAHTSGVCISLWRG